MNELVSQINQSIGQ